MAKYRIKITDACQPCYPGHSPLLMEIGGKRLPFFKRPDRAKDQTDEHVVIISAAEEWRVPGLREDGYLVEEVLEAPAHPTVAAERAAASAPEEI